MEEFDFGLSEDGELIVDTNSQDVQKTSGDDLRLQLAVNRIKSIDHNWFYDKVGANLEELIGKPIKSDVIELGTSKILNVLTYDKLWDMEDIHIQYEIRNKTNIVYTIYLRTYGELEEEKAIELSISIDLVKGVKIRYGW